MTATSPRIAAMDVLRGFAVMGILWMNITAFALPQFAYFNPLAGGQLSAGDMIFWLVSFLFFDGKMRALFSMLFGASMLLLIDREEMAGRDGRRTQVIRAAWLFLIGLAHYLLLWWGDILMIYALVGLAALFFVRNEPLSLVKWAFSFFLLHFLLCAIFIGSLYSWASAAGDPSAPASVREGFASFAGSFTDPLNSVNQTEIAIYRSGFLAILYHHLHLYATEWPRSFLFSSLDTLGFMLMGMAMLKGGFLLGRWNVDQYRRTARHCFLIGIFPMGVLAGWLIFCGFPALSTLAAAILWSFPFRIPLAVGWAALFLWSFLRLRDHPFTSHMANVGRMALSNYLGSTLVMCFIFYGWGFGMFARLSPIQLLPIVIAVWTLMLLLSPLWLKRFGIGPSEWLWRTLIRATPQKIRNSM